MYNGGSLFVPQAHPEPRREVITSRPWLMSPVGRSTEHAEQTTITLTGLHAHFEKARAALMRVSALLQGWLAEAAEPLNSSTVWHRVTAVFRFILVLLLCPWGFPSGAPVVSLRSEKVYFEFGQPFNSGSFGDRTVSFAVSAGAGSRRTENCSNSSRRKACTWMVSPAL